MVRSVRKRGKAYYQCASCKFLYADKHWAEQCQSWCTAHASCRADIIQHAVKP